MSVFMVCFAFSKNKLTPTTNYIGRYENTFFFGIWQELIQLIADCLIYSRKYINCIFRTGTYFKLFKYVCFAWDGGKGNFDWYWKNEGMWDTRDKMLLFNRPSTDLDPSETCSLTSVPRTFDESPLTDMAWLSIYTSPHSQKNAWL